MNWKSIELYDLPNSEICFWRYEFESGAIRHHCKNRYEVMADQNTYGDELKAVHYVDPREIK